MKYLVVKGWLGFGDRLESLKMAVKYALDNNLQIYVDWTDKFIRHTDESFYTYFNLINMPTLNSLDDILPDATYYPSYWNKDNIHQPLTDELFMKKIELKLDLGILNEKKKFNADVIVLSCLGNRTLYHNSNFFANVFRVINPKITEEVLARQQKYDLKNSLGIHIRGTDRITYKTNKGRYLPMQYLAVNVLIYGKNKNQVVVSDDSESIKFWKKMNPHSTVLSSLSLQNSYKGALHEISSENLQISKNDLNIDMLIDFFTLCSCNQVLSTYKDSRFANESMRLHPHVNQILDILSQPIPTPELILYNPNKTLLKIPQNSGFKLRNGRFKMDI
jgi:hypothetical protein